MKRVILFLSLFICVVYSVRLLRPDNERVSYYIDEDGRMISNLEAVKEGNEVRFVEKEAPKTLIRKKLVPHRFSKTKKTKYHGVLVEEHYMGCSCFSKGYIYNSYTYSQECFMKSSCSPIVLIPGILGTRLEMKYNLKKLYELGQAQGATDVQKMILSCFENHGAATDEVDHDLTYWISTDATSNWGIEIIQSTSDDKKHCFGLIGGQTEASLAQNGFEIYVDHKKEKNVLKSHLSCGLNSISFLAGSKIKMLPDSITGTEHYGYAKLANYLKEMGYVTNVNMFGLGYDWRKKPGTNQVFDRLADILKLSFEINQKKAIVVAHSYGTLNSLHFMNNIPNFNYKEYIERWVPVGGPLAGASLLLEAMVGNYNPLQGQIGMQSIPYLARDMPGVWALLPKDLKKESTNNEFISEFNSKYECGVSECSGNAFNFWPNTRSFSKIIRNYFNEPYVSIKKADDSVEAITREKFTSFLKDYLVKGQYKDYSNGELNANVQEKINTEVDKIIESSNSDNIYKLENPEVPITCVFMANHEMKGLIKMDLKKKAAGNENELNSNEKFDNDNSEKTWGDGTVSTFSSLIPTLKFAYDFSKNKANAHPVQFVEMIIENETKEKAEQLKYKGRSWSNSAENTYQPLQCQANTLHASMAADKYFIQLIASMAMSGPKLENAEALIADMVKPENNVKPAEKLDKNCYDISNECYEFKEYEEKIKVSKSKQKKRHHSKKQNLTHKK